MPSSATTRSRLEIMADGENDNAWATKVATILQMIDAAMDGIEDIVTAGGSTTLTNVDYTADQAKNRILNVTGTGGTIIIPNAEKNYLVRNASTGNVIISTGSGTTATIPAGNMVWVFSTGSNVVYMEPNYSGTYSPTVHTQSDCTASFSTLHYSRVGNMVTMGGKVIINASATGESAYLVISTPINSAFTADHQAGGSGQNTSRNDTFFNVRADSANRLKLQINAGALGSQSYWFTATYQVI